ncbi:conserved hypothetical protein [Solidesulfovibrio fructosivorans JJ]]|uniref:Uncharacterized protein n=1 Tax=Solidesulfovibrio fructosivorans JJ] TaxID=596151 RepID=E1JXJ0_SOLFR|nr:hypothetical protein [Solidesulfovibrio fructosivorans]EFL50967.1 conserved hypothetical protein [Solidesulfovibrio fructosivorans JJ]]
MSAINYSSAMGAEASYGIVSKTLDTMNNTGSSSFTSFAPTDKQTFGAAVVSKTLDYMNSGGAGSHASMTNDMSQTYQFSKDVLGAYTSGIGSLADANA